MIRVLEVSGLFVFFFLGGGIFWFRVRSSSLE